MSAEGAPSVAHYRNDAERLALDVFEEQHARHFLVLHSGLHTPSVAAATMAEDRATAPGALALSVLPIRRKEGSAYRLVSIGRTSNNDVVVADRSVSKFHAFFTNEERSTVFDGGSANGTFVNGERVPKRGDGDPVMLRPGDTLKVGAVEMTYLDAQGLVELARRWRH
jgi:hypothetical protein